MRAMLLETPGRPLRAAEIAEPEPDADQVKLRVNACGIGRTDLHLREGVIAPGRLPLILGHQIVGTVVGGSGIALGTRVGVPWLGWADGCCEACRAGFENLCKDARMTGRDLHGGFAEYAVADARFCVPLPSDGGDAAGIAPLLDSGVTAYRALRLADAAVPKRPERLGLFGFGAGAHIVSQIAAWQGRRVFAFVREGDEATARYARSYGAAWAGPSSKPAPQQLDAALVFAADGALVPAALRAVRPGGVVVCVAIHMSDIPSFAYAALAGERVLRSVANITRRDVRELLAVAARARVRTTVRSFPLAAAEDALAALRDRRIQGAAVLTIDRDR